MSKGSHSRFPLIRPHLGASVCPVSGNVSKCQFTVLTRYFVSNLSQSYVVRPGCIEEVLLVASDPRFPLKPENSKLI